MHESRKGKRHAWIPAGLYKGLKISDGARALHGELCSYANKDGICWPSLRKLSNDLNKIDPRTILRRQEKLEQLGLLEIIKEPLRRRKYRVNRDREAIPRIAAANRAKIEERKQKFGAYGRRGAAKRHARNAGAKVTDVSGGGDNSRPNEVTPRSPEQGKEQKQDNRLDLGKKNYGSGLAKMLLTKPGAPEPEPDWNGWASWLAKISGGDIYNAHIELMQMIEETKAQLGQSAIEAGKTLERILKIMRRSFPNCPTFAELLQREKDTQG